jgi:hypothetical protein
VQSEHSGVIDSCGHRKNREMAGPTWHVTHALMSATHGGPCVGIIHYSHITSDDESRSRAGSGGQRLTLMWIIFV